MTIKQRIAQEYDTTVAQLSKMLSIYPFYNEIKKKQILTPKQIQQIYNALGKPEKETPETL